MLDAWDGRRTAVPIRATEAVYELQSDAHEPCDSGIPGGGRACGGLEGPQKLGPPAKPGRYVRNRTRASRTRANPRSRKTCCTIRNTAGLRRRRLLRRLRTTRNIIPKAARGMPRRSRGPESGKAGRLLEARRLQRVSE